MKPLEILKELRKETKEVILFHSLAGKDSIMLIDLCSQVFDHVHCVYMYIIEDLEHMNRYKRFFIKQYQNTTWHDVEHYVIPNYIKTGHLGIKKDENIKHTSLAKIMIQARNDIGLNWIVLGSKQVDGLSRRLQLKTYEHEAIYRKTFKCYPLSKLTNNQVLAYISANDLISPLNYGRINQPSQSNDVIDPVFLSWCKYNFPPDYQKIVNKFPECEIILYRYENKAE